MQKEFERKGLGETVKIQQGLGEQLSFSLFSQGSIRLKDVVPQDFMGVLDRNGVYGAFWTGG